MIKEWVPDAGDVIWIDLDPAVGHEEAGKHPALVMSPSSYNQKTSLVVTCAMTTKKRAIRLKWKCLMVE